MSRKLPENKSPKKIGLTGGIGSGKSVVARIFQALHIPVFNSDLRARKILETDSDVRKAIVELLGEGAYDGESPRRAWIASRVFNNEALRKGLNQIVHPAVGRAFDKWLLEHSDAPYIIKEAAIIFETGIYRDLDATILVTAPRKVRVDRIRERDGMAEEEIEKRMAAQWSDEKKLDYADFSISNGLQDALIPQVLEIHKQLKKTAAD
jgi:dephospho-CoA kinase